eukprot:CAMPEP_0184699666 /NCGR_PEP_ID=MMETSP0313-20130426/5854_1 /TAXON_ID=2792 /ORGANISM="Porphyridium aerugineum, Strain SAG 1380-2" /LENGTH=410 /DNA_ID=CAMNT_0027158785 /DNA_START=170 /DNA_END=1402 /DNA_ORIENTATION=-
MDSSSAFVALPLYHTPSQPRHISAYPYSIPRARSQAPFHRYDLESHVRNYRKNLKARANANTIIKACAPSPISSSPTTTTTSSSSSLYTEHVTSTSPATESVIVTTNTFANIPSAASRSANSSNSAVANDTTDILGDGMVHRAVSDLKGWRVSGPSDTKGKLPAVIYFALAADQSLGLDPYNQFTQFALLGDLGSQWSQEEMMGKLEEAPLRVYSVTLPFHGAMTQNEIAFQNWARAYTSGQDLLSVFFNRVVKDIDRLIEMELIDGDNLWVAGLSRGGFVASHIAIMHPKVGGVLGYAPVTVPGDLKDMRDVKSDLLDNLSLKNPQHLEVLSTKPTRFYVGNRDETVSTRHCFEVVHGLAETNAKSFRSPPHEMVMYCSLGKGGHGTPVDIFKDGARWILTKMNLRNKK